MHQCSQANEKELPATLWKNLIPFSTTNFFFLFDKNKGEDLHVSIV